MSVIKPEYQQSPLEVISEDQEKPRADGRSPSEQSSDTGRARRLASLRHSHQSNAPVLLEPQKWQTQTARDFLL